MLEPTADGLHNFVKEASGGERCVFVFCTRGLSPHALKAAECAPPDLPLAIIGSNLAPIEVQALEASGLTFYNSPDEMDDNSAWEALFRASDADFLWLDSDCIVVDPALFHWLLEVPSACVARTCFPNGPLVVAGTHLTALNRAAIHAVQDRVVTSPTSYAFHRSQVGRFVAEAFSGLVTEQHKELLASLVAVDAGGRPIDSHGGIVDVYSNGAYLSSQRRSEAQALYGRDVERLFPFFDTLALFGFIARAVGFDVQVADPRGRALHVGAISYYRGSKVPVGPEFGFASASAGAVAGRRRTLAYDLLVRDEFARRTGIDEHPIDTDEVRALADAQGMTDETAMAVARDLMTDQGGFAPAVLESHPALAFLR